MGHLWLGEPQECHSFYFAHPCQPQRAGLKCVGGKSVEAGRSRMCAFLQALGVSGNRWRGLALPPLFPRLQQQ